MFGYHFGMHWEDEEHGGNDREASWKKEGKVRGRKKSEKNLLGSGFIGLHNAVAVVEWW